MVELTLTVLTIEEAGEASCFGVSEAAVNEFFFSFSVFFLNDDSHGCTVTYNGNNEVAGGFTF